MTGSRLRPLLALLALLGLAIVARLFQVQVKEHVTWAQEASRLLLEGHEEPYRRGRILDREGVVLARDEDERAVELVYRGFRREHPLGQVAHGRSLVEGRPVPLAEARAHLVEWAHGLVGLGAAELRAFGRGELDVPGARTLDRRVAAQRAADLLFYARGLLELDRREDAARWRALLELLRADGETRSLIELAAAVRGDGSADAVARERLALELRLAHSLERLGVLARWLQEVPDDAVDPLGRLVAELEDARRMVEDATAAKLFSEAVGFAPGRIEPDTLLACFDVGWIADLVGWDAARTEEWARDVRAAWLERWRDEACLPRVLWKLIHDPSAAPTPADFLASVAVVWREEGALTEALDGRAQPWREVEDVAVLARLDELFEADVPDSARALARGALPIQLPELRADPDDLRLLPEGDGPGSFRGLLALALAGSGRNQLETLLELAVRLSDVWERRYQETLRQALDEIRREADLDELGPRGGLRLAEGSRERAAERAEYLLKDYGSRARSVRVGGAISEGGRAELTYDVVYLLTRYEQDFPGFRVRKVERRIALEQPGDDRVPAEFLLGRVQQPVLEDLLRQRRDAQRLRELKGIAERAAEEEEELRRLIGLVRLPGEVKGVEGIEGFFEPELTGTNGYYQTRGAEDVFGPDGDELRVRDPVDGLDVVLTLHAGLQAASQLVLRNPDPDHDDKEWVRHPVGAIVILDEHGNVLAAASEPDLDSVIDPAATGERQVPAERTLTKRTFQPPGSCFKVFVAAYALEHGLDPTRTVTCAPLADGKAGYVDVRCWNSVGHGALDLNGAIEQSCNAYFAWLGETLSTEELAELCEMFGFGQPTGVRDPPPWDDGARRRAGLREHVAGLALPAGGGKLASAQRRRVANGLGRIEATPMQVARGMLAIARGELVRLRMASRVGDRELPLGDRTPLPLRASTLDFVRRAMRGVAEDPRGTAHKALSLEEIGIPVAVKTGSADLVGRSEDNGKVRKHAWVAGWIPARDPKLVFVVFEHDTQATSSHGAVFLARQLLLRPEVIAYLAAAGVDVSKVPQR